MDKKTLVARIEDQLKVFIQTQGSAEVKDELKGQLYNIIGVMKKEMRKEIMSLNNEIDYEDILNRPASSKSTPDAVNRLFQIERLKGGLDAISIIQARI